MKPGTVALDAETLLDLVNSWNTPSTEWHGHLALECPREDGLFLSPGFGQLEFNLVLLLDSLDLPNALRSTVDQIMAKVGR